MQERADFTYGLMCHCISKKVHENERIDPQANNAFYHINTQSISM